MEEKKTQSITINNKEYTADQLTDKQKMLISHLTDLDRKIGSTKFNLDQLQVGRDTFAKLLEEDLEVTEAEEVQRSWQGVLNNIGTPCIK